MGMGITVSGATRMLFEAPSKRSIMYRKGISHISASNASKTSKNRSKKAGKKGKYKYNYRSISGSILRAKTPAGAQKAVIQAKQALARVMRQAKFEDLDDEDLERTVLHIKRMEIIARRKKKHLEQEEKAARGEETAPEAFDPRESKKDIFSELMDGMSDGGEDALTEDDMELIKKLTEEISRMEQEMYEEELESFGGMETVPEDMTPEELDTLRKKHRCAEQKAIVHADMEYLRSVFEQLEREKTSALSVPGDSSSSFSFYDMSGSLSFGEDIAVDILA